MEPTTKDKINEINMNLKFLRNMITAWNIREVELTEDDKFGISHLLEGLVAELDKLL